MEPKDLSFNITVRQTCFDHVDEVHISDNGDVYAYVFIEPCGHFSFLAKSKEDLERGFERLFNAQPEHYDYIRAGWVVRTNHNNPLLPEYINDIDPKIYWDDTVLSLMQRKNPPTTFSTVKDLFALFNQDNSEPIKDAFIQIASYTIEERQREGVIFKVERVVHLIDNSYMLIVNEKEAMHFNNQLEGYEVNHLKLYTQTFILKADELLSRLSMKAFHEEDFPQILSTWKQWIEFSKTDDFLDFDEYLQKFHS